MFSAFFQEWTVANTKSRYHRHAAHYVSRLFQQRLAGHAGWQAPAACFRGISPVQGDRRGPTAVLCSAAKMDHALTGGTLLNMKFTPRLLEGEDGIANLAHLVRTYFKLGGHHVQFNVVSAETLLDAQAHPENHRDLIVRVAGYSDLLRSIACSAR